jgi:hypothetical protein
MHRVMKYMVSTGTRGLYIQPDSTWDGKDKAFEQERQWLENIYHRRWLRGKKFDTTKYHFVGHRGGVGSGH